MRMRSACVKLAISSMVVCVGAIKHECGGKAYQYLRRPLLAGHGGSCNETRAVGGWRLEDLELKASLPHRKRVGELGWEVGSGCCYLAFSLTLSFPHGRADIGALVFLPRLA